MTNVNVEKKEILFLYTHEDFERGISPSKKIDEIKWEHEKSITTSISEKRVTEMFPEERATAERELKRWQFEYETVKSTIKEKLLFIYKKSASENQWFWKRLVFLIDGKNLNEINKHILRLKRIIYFYSGSSPPKNRISDTDIERALSVPIENILTIKLRKSGNKLIGLCPLHNEKSPSFSIYTKTNTFYCFGCNQGGNIIKLIKLIHGLKFIEAVHYLLKI